MAGFHAEPEVPVAIPRRRQDQLEPPKGLKSNLMRSYARISNDYDDCKDPVSHKGASASVCSTP